MPDSVRTRFAPSPTGDLHVGGARTALFNWLFSRASDGTFILRIEDTDFDRSADRYIDRIQDALEWLGLDWDEGPGVGGPHAPYFQSDRLDHYHEAMETLREQGRVYRCYCTPEELEEQRERQRARGEAPRYSGRCRNLSDEQRAEFEQEGRSYAHRYRIPDEPVVVRDIVKGDVSFPADQVGDFIIVKSNGSPSYNFAVVVDDHAMEISHVVRGDDHLSNTPRQLYLYDAMGWEPPRWCHLPMILGQDGQRLSKRHGATDVREYRERGFLPEALVNALSLLGWSPPDGVEVKTVEELVEAFSLERVSKSPSRFDLDKVTHLNGKHLRALSDRGLVDRLREEGFLPDDLQEPDREQLPEVAAVLRDHLETLADFPGFYRRFFAEPIELTDAARERLADQPDAGEVIRTLRSRVEAAGPLDESTAVELVRETGEAAEQGGSQLYLPVRIALTGRVEGPEIHELMPVLGRERSLKRIQNVLDQIGEESHV